MYSDTIRYTRKYLVIKKTGWTLTVKCYCSLLWAFKCFMKTCLNSTVRLANKYCIKTCMISTIWLDIENNNQSLSLKIESTIMLVVIRFHNHKLRIPLVKYYGRQPYQLHISVIQTNILMWSSCVDFRGILLVLNFLSQNNTGHMNMHTLSLRIPSEPFYRAFDVLHVSLEDLITCLKLVFLNFFLIKSFYVMFLFKKKL